MENPFQKRNSPGRLHNGLLLPFIASGTCAGELTLFVAPFNTKTATANALELLLTVLGVLPGSSGAKSSNHDPV